MSRPVLPRVPYGAVYFRRSNPPRADWDRDYATAAEDGMNLFRHWFLWGSIEVKPRVFDWSGYDRQMELAARHGLGVIIAEMITSVPEWLFRAHPECLYRTAEGSIAARAMGGSSATGGFGHGSAGAVCLDTDGGRDLAGRFLTQLVLRYRARACSATTSGNECNYAAGICRCPATQAGFRAWLEARYGSLEALAGAWHRYSYASWDYVSAPASLGPAGRGQAPSWPRRLVPLGHQPGAARGARRGPLLRRAGERGPGRDPVGNRSPRRCSRSLAHCAAAEGWHDCVPPAIVARCGRKTRGPPAGRLAAPG